MFFTRLGRTFAHVYFWSGMVAVVYSLIAGLTAFEYPEQFMAQSKWVSRELGEGMTIAFMGLALGVLCEISSKRNKPDEQA